MILVQGGRILIGIDNQSNQDDPGVGGLEDVLVLRPLFGF
jgi:hypothetical protein